MNLYKYFNLAMLLHRIHIRQTCHSSCLVRLTLVYTPQTPGNSNHHLPTQSILLNDRKGDKPSLAMSHRLRNSQPRRKAQLRDPGQVVLALSSLCLLYALVTVLDKKSEDDLFSSAFLSLGVPLAMTGVGLAGWTRTRRFKRFVVGRGKLCVQESFDDEHRRNCNRVSDN